MGLKIEDFTNNEIVAAGRSLHTPDFGGTATTRSLTEAVLQNIRQTQ